MKFEHANFNEMRFTRKERNAGEWFHVNRQHGMQEGKWEEECAPDH